MNISIEEHEAKLQALRETLDSSIARGLAHDDEAVGEHVSAALDAWENAANVS